VWVILHYFLPLDPLIPALWVPCQKREVSPARGSRTDDYEKIKQMKSNSFIKVVEQIVHFDEDWVIGKAGFDQISSAVQRVITIQSPAFGLAWLARGPCLRAPLT